jgi:hypothetical protein
VSLAVSLVTTGALWCSAAGAAVPGAASAAKPSFFAAIAAPASGARVPAVAQAQPAAARHAAPTGAAVPAAPAETAAPSRPPVEPASTQSSRLSLDDVDQMSRASIVKALKGADAPASAPAASTIALAAPVAAAPLPARRPESQADSSRGTSVAFVGAFRDAAGQHVLYDFNGAVYPARVGEPLLNGWVARKVDGFLVTVAHGRTTWTLPITSPTSATVRAPAGNTVNLIGDLSSPLPQGFALGGQANPLGR